MSININNETDARKAYINVRYYHNSMHISPDEMGAISAKWENQLSNWDQIGASGQDANEYMISDDEFNNFKATGRSRTEDVTDGTSDRGESKVSAGVAHLATAGLGAAYGTALTIGKTLSSGLAKAVVWVAFGATAALALLAGHLKFSHINKEATEAANTLATETFPGAKNELEDTQNAMDEAAAEVEAKSEEASEANDEANSNMQDKQAEYDMYKARYDELKAKIKAGESLTEEEKAEYKKLGEYMGAVSEDITNTQDETTETVQGLYDEMESAQGKYDSAGEKVAEVQGITESAAEFDEDTIKSIDSVKTTAWVGMGAAAAACVAGLLGIAKALPKLTNPVTIAIGSIEIGVGKATTALAALAGTGFGFVLSEQNGYKKTVENEINIRKQTEEFNANALDNYNNQLNAYDGFKTNVESLELEKPQNEGAPTGPDIPEGEEPKKKTENDKGGKAA